MMLRAPVLALFALVLLAGPAVAAPPDVAVTTCGQVVPPRTLGYLTGDLDCTGYQDSETDSAVTLNNRATLDLRGFTLTGGDFGVGCFQKCRDGVTNCVSPHCRIIGGGAIANSVKQAVSGGRRIVVEGTTISGSPIGFHNFTKVTLVGVTITSLSTRVCHAVDRVELKDSTVTGNAEGITAAKHIRLVGSTVTGNGPFDLSSPHRPKVKKGSTCGISAGGPFGGSWHVCANA